MMFSAHKKTCISSTAVLFWLLTMGVPWRALGGETDGAKELDALWPKRDEPAVLQKIEAQVQAALAAKPDEYEFLWRAARLRYWMADGAQGESLRAKYSKEGWDFGERAIKANSRHVAGYHFAALNVGIYATAIGIAKALSQGLEKKFNALIDTAISLDETFDGAGPRVAKGRYFCELPWPKRDLKRSKGELEKALQTSPNNLRALLFLAETLLKDDDAKGAKLVIDRMGAVGATRDPPEERRVRLRARSVADKINEALR